MNIGDPTWAIVVEEASIRAYSPQGSVRVTLPPWIAQEISRWQVNARNLEDQVAALEARAKAAERKAALAEEALRYIVQRGYTGASFVALEALRKNDALSTPTGARNEGNDE